MAERRVFGGFGDRKKNVRGRYIWDKKLNKLVKVSGERVFSGVTIMPDTPEFVTSNITGKPEVITGRRTKKILMKQHGVVEYDPGMVDIRDRAVMDHERDVAKFKEEGLWDAPDIFEGKNYHDCDIKR